MPEFRRDESLLPHDVGCLSRTFREGKAGAIVVDCSVEHGTIDAAAFISEQKSAAGNFPGPCPVIERGLASTRQQIKEAAARGARAVCVPASDAARSEGLSDLIGAAHAAGLEVIVEGGCEEEVQLAVEAGAQIVCVRGVPDAEAAARVRKSIPDEVAAVAGVRGMQAGCREVEEAQRLRAAGFHGILLIDAARDGAEDVGYAEWALSTVKGQSKHSSAFAFSTLGTSGDVREETFTERWEAAGAERDPTAWAKWKKYKKTRDYQIRAQSWGP